MADGSWLIAASGGYLLEHRSHIDDLARDRRRRHHGGAHQQRPSRRTALTSLEITVRRRGTDLPPFEAIGVHPEAHRTTGAAPFKAGVPEHGVEPAGLRLAAHRLRAWNDKRFHVRRHPMASDDARGFLEIGQAPVRAGANERD